eukprot:1152273-Pelagomonas_calceolata.AAC.4
MLSNSQHALREDPTVSANAYSPGNPKELNNQNMAPCIVTQDFQLRQQRGAVVFSAWGSAKPNPGT